MKIPSQLFEINQYLKTPQTPKPPKPPNPKTPKPENPQTLKPPNPKTQDNPNMEITEVFYPRIRQEWRDWLLENHQSKPEIWVQRFIKASGKPSLSYDELVEECLCFGWIDGTQKKYDEESHVQRITPRRKKSFLSELNRQRIWKLQRQGLMTPAGIAPIESQIGTPDEPLVIPDWILEQLRRDEQVWKHFEAFPHFYKRLKIGWINENLTPSRQAEAQKRLDYLLKMTAQGKRYGAEPMAEMGIGF
jgi:uncharacterized protein YdeI (YjbR/CyaY-like superfamily)